QIRAELDAVLRADPVVRRLVVGVIPKLRRRPGVLLRPGLRFHADVELARRDVRLLETRRSAYRNDRNHGVRIRPSLERRSLALRLLGTKHDDDARNTAL